MPTARRINSRVCTECEPENEDKWLTCGIVYVDISGAADGLLSFTEPVVEVTNLDRITDQFNRTADGKLEYAGAAWLACPQAEGEYMVYPEKAYSKTVGQDKCTEFEVSTKKVRTPKIVCVYH